jgi:hypothetical protein
MKRRYLCVALLATASLSPIATADFGDLVLAGRAGTLRLGGGLMLGFRPGISGRVGAAYAPLHVDGEIGDVDYGLDLRLMTVPLTMDWYPLQNGFHLRGGLILNQSKIDLDTGSGASRTIGGTTYSPADPGAVHGRATFPRLRPYVGIGWSNVFGKNRRWGIVGDLGVAFLGRPHVALAATGPIAANPTFQGDRTQEQEDVQDDLGIRRLHPLFSVSLFYRF